MSRASALVPSERISSAILMLRGHRVMLDADLAAFYGVETRALVQAVKRNRERFPEDFMFQLSEGEADALRSQIVISNGQRPEVAPGSRSQSVISKGRGGRRYAPYAFTEQGVAMLSSVLRSRRAIQVNVEIMRAFVRLRGVLALHRDLADRIDALERKYDTHDQRFKLVFDAIRQIMQPPAKPRRRIGFAP
jgi:hypothetical protein